MRHMRNMSNTKSQSGFVLIIGLVVLVLLTIIMLTAMRTASLEERMAGNLRQQNIAFQAAESALREAEGLISSDATEMDWDGDGEMEPSPFYPLLLTGGPFQNLSDPICDDGLCGSSEPLQSDAIKALTDDEVHTASTGIAGIDEPQYVIELIRVRPSTDSRRLYATFRVTARAWGEDPNSEIQLQSTYSTHIYAFVL